MARRLTSICEVLNVTNELPASSQARDPSPIDSTDADRLRALLKLGGLSQRAAARLLNVEERTMRQWCAGQGNPPASVFRALGPVILSLCVWKSTGLINRSKNIRR